MESLKSRFSTWFCCSLFLLLSLEAFATEGKNIAISVSRNGTIVLEITNRSADAQDLSVPRDFSIRASTDLEHWVEIGRISSLEDFSEIRDLDSKDNPIRFYKAELVELNQASLIQVASFVEALESHHQYASGIVLEGTTLADIIALRENEAELRAKLQELIDSNLQLPDGLVTLYQKLLGETDQTLASNPLEIKIGVTILEIEVSEAMRMISEEYQRLGRVSLNDYDRLPGIAQEDLAGLETLVEHLNARQVGIETNIPIFDTLSPFGNFTLIDRLIRKYGNILLEKTTDFDNDGNREIDYNLFRALVNGTELASREAEVLIRKILDENPIPWDAINASPVSSDSLKTVLVAIHAIEQTLEIETEALVRNKEYEDVFEELILALIDSKLGSRHRGFIDTLERYIKHPSILLEFLPEANLPILSAPPTATELEQFVSSLTLWNKSIRKSVTDFLESVEISEQLKDDLKSTISQKMNGYWMYPQHIYGLYETHFKRLDSKLTSGRIIFDLPSGVKIEIYITQHPVLLSLPYTLPELLKHPGIASAVSEAELQTLHSNEDWNTLSRISFSSSAIWNPKILSRFGRNVELYTLLLERFGNTVVSDGAFDPSAFARAILMSPELDALISAIDQSISSALDRIDNLDIDPQVGLSKDEYAEITDTLKSLKQSIQDSASETLENLDDSISYTLKNALQASYNLLIEKVDSILTPSTESRLRIVIDQSSYSIPAQSAFDILESQLKRIAVMGKYDLPTRRQYLRLNGVTESLVLEVNPSYYRDRLRNLWKPAIEPDSSESLDLQTSSLDIKNFLIPSLLEAFGTEILDGNNEVDLDRFKQKLLDGVFTPVEDGLSIKSRHLRIARDEASKAQSKLILLDLNTWEGRLEAETIYESMKQNVIESVAPLIKELDPSEIQTLEHAYTADFSLRYLYNNYINLDTNYNKSDLALTMQDGATFSVPLQDIKAIPSFPYSLEYWDRELFVGIEESDMETSKLLSRYIRYTKSGLIDEADRYIGLSRDKLIVNLLIRTYNDPHFGIAHPKDDLFKDGKISVEIFRRIIKGVDALHREALAQARLLTDEALERMRILTRATMTMENALAVYNEASNLQSSLIEYLTNLSNSHEREDVIEIEEAITAIYKDIIDEMIEYYRSNKLVIDVNGTLVTIPVRQISDALISLIEARFPGEGIGTFHFAALAGISIEDLRGYNKLEAFLGAQIIALPRNSQYVEILSKLSEIGFMQLAHDAIMRFFDEVVDVSENKIDLDTLLVLLMDTDLSFNRVKEIAQSIHDDATTQLNAIQNPNTSNGLEEALSITNDLRREMRSRVNDHISYFTSQQIIELQNHIDGLYRNFISNRDARFIGTPVSIETVDHQIYNINLNDIESSVVNRMQELILANPSQETDDELIWGIGPRLSIPIVSPWPPLEAFDPDHTLTRLGFHVLVTRLIENYGITVSENGAFSLDKLLEELGKPNRERAEELFESLKTQALAKLKTQVPNGTDPIAHQDVLTIHEFLAEERQRFLDVLGKVDRSGPWINPIESAGNAAWLSVMNRYEELLFDRDMTLLLGNQTVLVPMRSLIDQMNQAYDDGYTQLLDSYLTDGESIWLYDNFKALYGYPIFYEYYPRIGDSAENGYEKSVDTPRFPFTLGDLTQVPGIDSRDLQNLESEQNDGINIEPISAAELIKALFNLRILSPGSSLQTIGWTAATLLDSRDRFDYWPQASSFLELSPRDVRFRLLIELIQGYADILVDSDGRIDLEAFEILLQTTL